MPSVPTVAATATAALLIASMATSSVASASSSSRHAAAAAAANNANDQNDDLTGAMKKSLSNNNNKNKKHSNGKHGSNANSIAPPSKKTSTTRKGAAKKNAAKNNHNDNEKHATAAAVGTYRLDDNTDSVVGDADSVYAISTTQRSDDAAFGAAPTFIAAGDDISRRNSRGQNRERKEVERANDYNSFASDIIAQRGGICPANGNTHAVYVTTHVGTNIESYDTFGRYLGPLINTSSVPQSVGLQKLRGMVYGPDGLLYVAASRSSFSRIFAISPTGVPLPLRKGKSSGGVAGAIGSTVSSTSSSASSSSSSNSGASASTLNPHLNSFNSPDVLGDSITSNLQQQQKGGANGNNNNNNRFGGNGLHGDGHDDIDGDFENDEDLLGSSSSVGDDISNALNRYVNGGDSGGLAALDDKYTYRYGEDGEVLLSPASPELFFLSGEQRMQVTLPRKYRMNKDCTRNYVYTLAKLDMNDNPNMNHPYSFFFHPEDGTMFVTNQNSITVTRYVGPTTTKRQLLDIMAATAGVLHRTPKLTASLKGLLKKLAPIAEGDPVPYAGGVSGYAGMPLPPSYTILHALRLTPDDNSTAASSAAGRIAKGSRGAVDPRSYLFNAEEGNSREEVEELGSNVIGEGALLSNNNDFASGGGVNDVKKASSSSSDDDAHAKIPSQIPSKAIGVFAAGWCPFYNLLSVRGMAISPRMLYSVTDRMFVHDMEVVPISNLAGSAARAASLRGGAVSSSSDAQLANLDRGLIGNALGGLGQLLFGKSSTSKSNSNEATMTIRRRVDLSTKTVIGLRLILVADVIGNSIHVLHEHTGELMWSYTNVVRQPIQIHFPKSAERTSTSGDYWFYVTCKDGSVYKLHLRKQTSATARTSVAVLIRSGTPMKAVSGFFENPAHNTLYIADRKGRAIHTYSTPDTNADTKSLYYTGKFVANLVGEPEHILYTSVTQQRHIPYCYELNHDGSLRFTSLCLAWQMYFLAGIAGIVVLFFAWTRIGRAIVGGLCGWLHSAFSPSSSSSSGASAASLAAAAKAEEKAAKKARKAHNNEY